MDEDSTRATAEPTPDEGAGRNREAGWPWEPLDVNELNRRYHAVWFADQDTYMMARRCARCGAAPWVECDAPQKRDKPDLANRQHVRRFDDGLRHYLKDVGNAPWPEERAPDQSYSTIDYSARPSN